MADDKNKSTQAERLVQLRRDKGLTAEQLAQAMTAAGAKVSRGAISNWERGTNGIVSSKLPTLAHILGCSEGYLLRGELKNDSDNNKEVSKSAHSHNKNSQNYMNDFLKHIQKMPLSPDCSALHQMSFPADLL